MLSETYLKIYSIYFIVAHFLGTIFYNDAHPVQNARVT